MMGGTKGGKPNQKQPTAQGPEAAGPGNRHGTPPDNAPGLWGTGERSFDPAGGKPAAKPEETARKVLDQANPGPKAEGDAGPEAASGKAGPGKG